MYSACFFCFCRREERQKKHDEIRKKYGKCLFVLQYYFTIAVKDLQDSWIVKQSLSLADAVHTHLSLYWDMSDVHATCHVRYRASKKKEKNFKSDDHQNTAQENLSNSDVPKA